MERTERMIDILCDEWENIVILCSRVNDDGDTDAYRFCTGNALANQQLLEDTLDDMGMGQFIGGDDGEEETFSG